jgi:hypothetical protein
MDKLFLIFQSPAPAAAVNNITKKMVTVKINPDPAIRTGFAAVSTRRSDDPKEPT